MKPNIDDAEIKKFDALADEWWNPEGPMKPLHQLNPLRLAYVQQHAKLAEKYVLDVGCGAGILTESLAQQHTITTGIDMSPKAIAAAKQHAKLNNLTINYLQQPIEEFAKTHAAAFDVITCMELLEHVPEPAAFIQQLAHLLKPGGLLICSTINRSLKAYLGAIIMAEYVMRFLPRGTHQYEKFIKPSELHGWANDANLDFVHLQGLSFHPLNQSFSLSKDVDINYLACFTKPESAKAHD